MFLNTLKNLFGWLGSLLMLFCLKSLYFKLQKFLAILLAVFEILVNLFSEGKIMSLLNIFIRSTMMLILAGNKVARFSFLNLEQKGGIY
ncbi:hypothetical protein BIX54_00065 [Mycoplasmoides pneumoniae]|nr:hypothetical protein [Mycoplasmoides pneumoniae]AJR18995.1 hypothetical protein C985_00695 [Mycoplasmoides pneumoniae M129-B7]ALA29889.1 hypothetical protein C897_00065 [Mycoplasmoides pneumoniae PI 1428]ALA32003.1 hypothetical protein F533_00065 [Mycoplasmoides pneumoniae 51494]ALA32706.1 hypothetical protein F530_00065 [Mycoplasmoides pneumoniae 54089]ALA33410.1 hypothetical protein F531_00065 [Mycoplasmoides pneumoniae 54524]ALA34115.1 hypothetical protein F537_00065 [Mycoplasmoides pne